MKYLLDTHIWLWWLLDSPKLPVEAKTLIANEKNTIYVSTASLWEIRIKQQIGKIELPENFAEDINHSDFINLPITFEHVNTLVHFPLHHHDPFDRLLIAQAYYEHLILLTKDKMLEHYEVPMILFRD
ncbi:MAG: type II toxin-antitoxin system VapC family toxin [Gammaproteobacteria bacterium]